MGNNSRRTCHVLKTGAVPSVFQFKAQQQQQQQQQHPPASAALPCPSPLLSLQEFHQTFLGSLDAANLVNDGQVMEANDTSGRADGPVAPYSEVDTEDAGVDGDVSDRVLEVVMDDEGPSSIIMRDTEEALDAATSSMPNPETQEVDTLQSRSAMSDATYLEYKCQFCSFQTPSEPNLQSHMESEHDQPNSETYVLMEEELMKHALPSHEEFGGKDPLKVEIPDREVEVLDIEVEAHGREVEVPEEEEEGVQIVCQWMSPQHCAKTFASVYEFNSHVRVDHIEVQGRVQQSRLSCQFAFQCCNLPQLLEHSKNVPFHMNLHFNLQI